MSNKIAILDFGSQFSHLLANRVRRLGVYSELLDAETKAHDLRDYSAIILSGGPASVNDPNSPQLDTEIFNLGLPILGICYGHQLIMHHLGGKVEKGKIGEYGLTDFTLADNSGHLSALEKGVYSVYASHFDTVSALPSGFEALGYTNEDKYSATWNREKNIFTLQFHPEVSHTPCGMQILDSFLDVANLSRDWNLEQFIKEEMKNLAQRVGDKNVFMFVSGGVDSTVAYVLLVRALGEDRVKAVYVDTGFMRMNESTEIQGFLAEAGAKNLHTVYAEEDFFTKLIGVVDPEKKRGIIGETFLEIQARLVKELDLNPEEWILGQGTIYPDTIESGGTKNADKIKTHHNRVPEIEAMIAAGKVVEPLKDLYKDEVRWVGKALGLPEKMIERHPFPGPGLAVRCLCSDGAEENAEGNMGKMHEKLQIGAYTGHVLPVKSVGVQGDERSYRHPLALEGAADFPVLQKLATSIVNESKTLNRVIYNLGVKIENISLSKAFLTKERVELLQRADALVAEALPALDPKKEIWQFPTVLIPLSVNGKGSESLVLRPVSSNDAMTASVPFLPWDVLAALVDNLLKLEEISAVFLDITNKPPATIEWE